MSSIFIPNKCPVKIMSLTNFNNKIIWCTSLTDPSVKQSSMLLFTHHPTQIPNWNEQIDSNKKTPKRQNTQGRKKKQTVVGQNPNNKNSSYSFFGDLQPPKTNSQFAPWKKIPECHDERVEGFCGENFREGKITQYDCWGMSFIYFNRWYKVGPQKQLQVGLYITPIRLGV